MSMYKVAIPVTNWYPNREMDREGTLRELRRAGATRVWLCTARGIEEEDVLSAQLTTLKRNRLFFEERGIEVGVWLSSLGHGGALAHEDGRPNARAARYTRLVGIQGGTCEDSFCPSCEPFATDYSQWIGRIAQTGAKLIMLDDDYRLSLHNAGGPGCCCEKHMAEYRRRVGEDVRREDMEKLIFTGGPNKYRDAWLAMGREALLGLAGRIRAEVDAVDPSVRVGVCAVMSTWDSDGLNAVELTKALAGSTKPFLRTIGAPYWAAMGQLAKRLNHIIELARVQRTWCEGQGVELFTEGDAYPRPRFNVPAAYLEAYDMALRADGRFDGILKYMIDYTASLRYERGYIDRMVKNKPAYEWIERHLSPGEAVGADVVARCDWLKGADLPDDMTGERASSEAFYPAAQRLLTDSSVPVAYGTRSVHVICGEDARAVDLDLLQDGAALDMAAARILTGRGVDVGLDGFGAPVTAGGEEYFPVEDEYVACGPVERFVPVTLKVGADVLSTLRGMPVCWKYENAAGQRFLCYAFDMDRAIWARSVTRGYARQRQLIEGLQWAGRRPLPASCPGEPDLYILCKRTPEGLAVGLWNLSCDVVISPVIRVAERGEVVAAWGGPAQAEDDEVAFDSDIAPFGFAGFVLKPCP